MGTVHALHALHAVHPSLRTHRGRLDGQLVVEVGAHEQADAGEKLAHDGQQHAGLPPAVPVGPGAHEQDQDGRQRALDERLPARHAGRQLLNLKFEKLKKL